MHAYTPLAVIIAIALPCEILSAEGVALDVPVRTTNIGSLPLHKLKVVLAPDRSTGATKISLHVSPEPGGSLGSMAEVAIYSKAGDHRSIVAKFNLSCSNNVAIFSVGNEYIDKVEIRYFVFVEGQKYPFINAFEIEQGQLRKLATSTDPPAGKAK